MVDPSATTSAVPAPAQGADPRVHDHRTRPRRRGEVLRTAILEAALAELADVGYRQLSMERVAERSHTSKASLYRRWPGKIELVMDAVHHTLPDPASAPDTGSLRGDLLATLRAVAAELAGPAGQAMRGLLSDALSDPEKAAHVRTFSRGRTTRMMRVIVDRAAERGELDAASITARQLEAGHAVLRFHFLTTGTVPDHIVDEIVDEIILPLFGERRPRAPCPESTDRQTDARTVGDPP